MEEEIIGICEHCDCDIMEENLGMRIDEIMICRECMLEYDGYLEK